MNYEIVELKEMIVAGISARTSNDDPNMGEILGRLWSDFYQKGIYTGIENKVTAYAIGLYSNYDKGSYDATVGVEVSEMTDEKLVKKVIPAGKYAKFRIYGDMVEAVKKAWGEIWQMDLERSFTGDFEVYKSEEMENAEIDIYIALK